MEHDIKKLQAMKITQLTKIAEEFELPEASGMKKQELIFLLIVLQ